MSDVVQDFVNEVTATQEKVAEKREDMSAALVEHMLKLPGMDQIFETDMEKQMFGQQITNMVEFAARQKAEQALQPPLAAPTAPVDGNGGPEA